MECQKIISLLGNTLNSLTKFRTKNLVEINDDANGTCNTNSQIKFKSSMSKSEQSMVRQQIMPIERLYLNIFIHLLIAKKK